VTVLFQARKFCVEADFVPAKRVVGHSCKKLSVEAGSLRSEMLTVHAYKPCYVWYRLSENMDKLQDCGYEKDVDKQVSLFVADGNSRARGNKHFLQGQPCFLNVQNFTKKTYF